MTMLEVLLPTLPVVIYHGARDLVVPLRGLSHLVSTLQWKDREMFLSSSPLPYWVEEEGEVWQAGHATTGGNLTLLVLHGAGGMVPIRWVTGDQGGDTCPPSQPGVASQVLSDLLSLATGGQVTSPVSPLLSQEFEGGVPSPPAPQPLYCGQRGSDD